MRQIPSPWYRDDLLDSRDRLRQRWRRFHRILSDASEERLIISAQPAKMDRYWTIVASYLRRVWPGSDGYWGNIRVKMKYFVEGGNSELWIPVFRIIPEQGRNAPPYRWPPRLSDAPVTQLIEAVPKNSGSIEQGNVLWSASARRKFEERQAIRAQLIIGFKLAPAATGRMQLRSITLYE
jgi:hypothetical protein